MENLTYEILNQEKISSGKYMHTDRGIILKVK